MYTDLQAVDIQLLQTSCKCRCFFFFSYNTVGLAECSSYAQEEKAGKPVKGRNRAYRDRL